MKLFDSAPVSRRRWLSGLGGLALGLPFLDALAPRGISAFNFGSPDTLIKAIPSANGLFTARSLARMYAALAEGGELDGTRLLSRATLARAANVSCIPSRFANPVAPAAVATCISARRETRGPLRRLQSTRVIVVLR